MEEISKHATIFKILFSNNIEETTKEDYTILSLIVLKEFTDTEGNFKRIPYEIIAKYVFDSVELYEEGNEFLFKNLEKIVEFSEPANVAGITKFKDKVESHYKLCKEQKEYIQKNIFSLDNQIVDAKKTITQTVTETKVINADIMSTKNKMYTEFVAILGIFSALMFGMISGYTSLGESFSLLADSNYPLGRVLMGSSAIAIGLVSFMYTLIQWIGHLIKNPIRSEDFEPDSSRNKGLTGFEYRHSLFLLVVYLLMNIFLVGLIALIASNAGILNDIYLKGFEYNKDLFLDYIQTKLFSFIAIAITLFIIAFIDLVLINKRLFVHERKKSKLVKYFKDHFKNKNHSTKKDLQP